MALFPWSRALSCPREPCINNLRQVGCGGLHDATNVLGAAFPASDLDPGAPRPDLRLAARAPLHFPPVGTAALKMAAVAPDGAASWVLGRLVGCGVATLDYDHTQTLGETLAKIGREKGGVFKCPGCPCFSVPQDGHEEETLPVLAAAVAQVAAGQTITGPAAGAPAGPSPLHVVCPLPPGAALPPPAGLGLGLAGDFQRYNAALALALAACVPPKAAAPKAAASQAEASPEASDGGGGAAVPASAHASAHALIEAGGGAGGGGGGNGGDTNGACGAWAAVAAKAAPITLLRWPPNGWPTYATRAPATGASEGSGAGSVGGGDGNTELRGWGGDGWWSDCVTSSLGKANWPGRCHTLPPGTALAPPPGAATYGDASSSAAGYGGGVTPVLPRCLVRWHLDCAHTPVSAWAVREWFATRAGASTAKAADAGAATVAGAAVPGSRPLRVLVFNCSHEKVKGGSSVFFLWQEAVCVHGPCSTPVRSPCALAWGVPAWFTARLVHSRTRTMLHPTTNHAPFSHRRCRHCTTTGRGGAH